MDRGQSGYEQGPISLWTGDNQGMERGQSGYGTGPTRVWTLDIDKGQSGYEQGQLGYGPGPIMLWTEANQGMDRGQSRIRHWMRPIRTRRSIDIFQAELAPFF